MSTLDDELAELEAKEKPSTGEASASAVMNRVAAHGTVQAGLLLVKRDKKQWALPWAHFGGAEYFPAEAGVADAELERIEITFLHKLVTLQGRNLAALMRPIKELRLDSVLELPVRYLEAESVHKGETAVTRIDVVAERR